jgi:hypothetical protein
VKGGWKKLHNERRDLYSSPSIIRMIRLRMKWARHLARVAVKRNVYRLRVGQPEEKRPPGRTRRR